MNTIVYTALDLIRKISILLNPVIPDTTLKVLKIFDINDDKLKFEDINNHKFLESGKNIRKLNILFKKIENDWFTLSLRSRAFNK